MRLLVIDHACVLETNQRFFSLLEDRTGWQLTVVAPRTWKSPYGTHLATRHPSLRGELKPLRVALTRHTQLHFYLARLRKLFYHVSPHAIYVNEEPYALPTVQAYVANDLSTRVPIGYHASQSLLKRFPWPFSVCERYVFRQSSFAVATSDAALSVVRAKGYLGPAEVLPWGVPADGAEKVDSDPSEVTEAPLRVGYVGRLVYEKGVDTLIEAVALLPPGRVEARIVGAGPAQEELKALAGRLGAADRVTFEGYIEHSQVARVYRAVDVIAVPSRTASGWKEPFGRVVIEALAAGAPVVTSDSGELPRLVEQTGGGWTFREGDAAGLAALLSHLVDHPAERAEKAAQGGATVAARFDEAEVAERLASLIGEAVDP